jgi:RNA polymerase sigma-70 factor (ECF subfamily)
MRADRPAVSPGLSPLGQLVEDADMDDQADRADVAATLLGNAEAYRRLVERHQQAIARRMRRFARDRQSVEELVQDVFVQAFFSLRGYAGRAPVEHWLNRIATHVGYAYLKRVHKSGRADDGGKLEDVAATEEDPSAAEAVDRLHRVMEQLSPRNRLVITLMYLEDQSVAETAELTGWSQTMVKVQAFRARSKLRKLMEKNL